MITKTQQKFWNLKYFVSVLSDDENYINLNLSRH